MLQPKTIAALLFLAAAGGAAYWQLTRTDHHRETAPPPSPVPGFAPAEIDELAIADAKTGTAVTLARAGAGWTLTAPLSDTADAKLVTSALDQLAAARVASRPTATAPSSWSKLGVGADAALTVTLRRGGAVVAALHLSLDGRYVRVGERPEVYEVHGLNRAMLAREVRTWRDRTITSFDASRVRSVRVEEAAGASAAAERTLPADDGGNQSWTLTDGSSLVGQLDDAVPAGITARMQSLAGQDVVDGKSLADAGLDPPRLVATVVLDDGSEQALLVGADADATNVYLGRRGSERIWLAPKATIESFARPPLQWRDKTIARLEPAEVTQIDIERDGARLLAARTADGWKILKPAGLTAAPAKLDELAGAMRNLRGTAIATADRRAAGLARPTATARFTDATGATTTVAIGAQVDSLWHVSASGRADILLVADYLIKRLLVAPADVAQ